MLKLRLFGVPVGIHPSFLLIALFGIEAFRGIEILAWTGAVLVAVVIHELGHALTARRYGASVRITVFALGGVTTWSVETRMSPVRRLIVAAAGSTVGVLAGGAVLLLARRDVFGDLDGFWEAAVVSFVWASLVWGLANWIPIRQLDGGHMVEAVVQIVAPQRAESIVRGVSLVAGVAAAVVAFRFGWYFAAIFAVILTLADLNRPRAPAGHRPPTTVSGDRPEPPAADGPTPDLPI